VSAPTRSRVPYGAEVHKGLRLQFESREPSCGPSVMRWMLGPGADRDPTWPEVLAYVREPERCPDCETPKGSFHRPGCDLEECPLCHLQLIGCDC
jgi:hypothetical protein